MTWPGNGPVLPLAGVACAPDGGPGWTGSASSVARASRCGRLAEGPWRSWDGLVWEGLAWAGTCTSAAAARLPASRTEPRLLNGFMDPTPSGTGKLHLVARVSGR